MDPDGHVLDTLVQRRRNKAAAKKFFRKLLKGLTYVPRVIVTNELRSSSAGKWEMLPSVEHRQHRYPINRAENSYQPTPERERCMRRFTFSGHTQRVFSAYSPIASHCRPRRLLQAYAAPTLQALTGYADLGEAIHALGS